MIKVGITECGDPAFNKEVFARLLPANIIITKNVMTIEEELLENKEKIILHATVTGMGGSTMEPFVPGLRTSIDGILSLIRRGFPARQIVYRVDPIIPEPEWSECAMTAIREGSALARAGVERMRYSIIDLYPHVRKRLQEKHVYLKNGSFSMSYGEKQEFCKEIEQLGKDAGFRYIEICGEYTGTRVGCISEKDIRILGLDPTELPSGTSGQRKECLCCAGKTELLRTRKRCPHKCLYCYWKKDGESTTHHVTSNGV